MKTFFPVLVTLPHCSGEVPPEIWESMQASGYSEASIRRRLISGGDPFTDLLYALPTLASIPAQFSRFVVDLNRHRDEVGPNGVIKTTDFELQPFYAPGYQIDSAERERRLRLYYDPFQAEVDSILALGQVRFLMDGHSMSARGPLLGPDAGQARPALCLGNFGDAAGNPLRASYVSLEPSLAIAIKKFAETLIGQAFPLWDENKPPQPIPNDNIAFLNGYMLNLLRAAFFAAPKTVVADVA